MTISVVRPTYHADCEIISESGWRDFLNRFFLRKARKPILMLKVAFIANDVPKSVS